MSVYIKEKPEYLDQCFESLENQTVKANEWVLVQDGPITDELLSVINKYKQRGNPIVDVILPKNQGLGIALANGIEACSNEIVARMDTDDIAREDRFELQLKEFIDDPNLDICGSHIIEFEGSKDNVVAKRTVPLDDKAIKKYQKRRDSFNHMTVMYKKSAVLKAGNYQSCLLMEDTLLWANMFISGVNAKNIDDYLVYARVGKDMFERRGGFAYYKKYKQGRKKVYKTGYISWWDYKVTVIIQFIIALIPNKLRGFIFKKLLHK